MTFFYRRCFRYATSLALLGLAAVVLALSPSAFGQTIIEPPDGSDLKYFGRSVAVNASTVVVGATHADGNEWQSGAAYVFQFVSGSWIFRTKLIAADGASGDDFGISVDIDDSTIVVGAPDEDESGLESGAAYVFQDTSASGDWSSISETKIVAAGLDVNDQFGYALAIDGNTILIAADLDDDCGTDCGAVYFIMDNSPLNDWSSLSQQKITPSTATERFGYKTVSLDGTQAAVGAMDADGPLGNNCGATYILQDESAASDWSVHSESVLYASDGEPYSYFGSAVDIQGRVVVVGAESDDELGHLVGAAYILQDISEDGNWSTVSEQKIVGSVESVPVRYFGSSVALYDSHLIIGARQAQLLPGSLTGMFSIFSDTSDSSDWSSVEEIIPDLPGVYPEDIGIGVSADMDAEWMIVGAPSYEQRAGAAYIYPVESDLTISLADSDDPVPLGSDFTYTLSSSCIGPIGSYPVSITNTLPPEVAYVDATGVGWSCDHLAGVVTCTRSGSEVGTFPEITLTVTAPSEESIIVNNASISGGEADPNPGDNTASEDTTVLPSADLEIVLTDSPEPVLSGGQLVYNIQISNSGPDRAQALVLTDSLPEGSAFLTASGDEWSCGVNGLLTVTCTRAFLDRSTFSVVTIVVNAPEASDAAGTQVFNQGSIDADSIDLNLSNNQDTEQTTVFPFFATRTLPSEYLSGTPLPVTIDVQPTGGLGHYSILETVPTDWVVDGINHGGVYHESTDQIEWIFFDTASRVLSYDVEPPITSFGTKTFVGQATFNSIDQLFWGDAEIVKGGHHQADSNLDWSLTTSEYSALATAWRTGSAWPVDPNPVLVSSVSNSSYLWVTGGGYYYDPAETPPQIAGSPASPELPVQIGSASSAFSLTDYEPGQPLTVTIEVSVDSGAHAFAVEDSPPTGWAVSAISDTGVFDSVNGKVKWGPFSDNSARNIQYEATPPLGQIGGVSFIGELSVDGGSQPIGGDRTLFNGAEIFSDGFESGDTALWSRTVP